MNTENFCTHQAIYTDDFVQAMYNHFLSQYQDRYSRQFPINITWAHIRHWRLKVTFYGRILVKRGLISYNKYLADKAFKTGEPLLFTEVQKATALTYKEAHA